MLIFPSFGKLIPFFSSYNMGQQKPTTIKKRVDFPVYGLEFTADDTLIAAGGGGANRSGVKNNMVSFKIDAVNRQLQQIDSLLLSDKEDCPMSIACHPQLPLIAAGINSAEEIIQLGENKNCHIFNSEYGKLQLSTSFSTSTSKSTDEYQKVTRFSRSGSYLVTGFSDGRITVLNTNDWSLVFPSLRFKNVQDVDFDIKEQHIAIATSSALIILSMEDGRVVQVIDSPKLNKNTVCEIRCCRYGITERGIQTLYAVVNPTSRGRGFICAWKLRSKGNQYPVTKTKTAGISRKSITSFTISHSGDILAYASTDLSIGLVDAQQLKPLLRVDKAHGFAITSLIFNHSGHLLASAGADNCCRVMMIPDLKKSQPFSVTKPLFILLDMLLFALLMHIIVTMVDQGTLNLTNNSNNLLNFKDSVSLE